MEASSTAVPAMKPDHWGRYALGRLKTYCFAHAGDRIVYSDGVLAVDLPGVNFGPPLYSDVPGPSLEFMLAKIHRASGEPITEANRAELVAWCPPFSYETTACNWCRGDGEIVCPDDNCAHKHDCSNCQGTGDMEVPPRDAPVLIHGQPFNGRLLWQILVAFHGVETVTLQLVDAGVARPGDAYVLRVAGGDCTAILMQMASRLPEEKEKKWPA